MSSNQKYQRFRQWINYNIISNHHNWTKINNGLLLNEFIDEYYDNDIHFRQAKGWIFEYICKYIIKYKYETNDVYLNKEIPQHLRTKLNMPSVDKGIDIIFCNDDGKWVAVQCKYKSDYKNRHIKKEFVSDFIHELKLCNKDSDCFQYGLYMTNVENITPRFNDENIKWFLSINLKKIINKTFLEWIIKPINSINNNKNNHGKSIKQFKLRYYQKDAINALLMNESRAQCIMPCGTGKTFVILNYLKEIISKSQSKQKVLLLCPSLLLLDQIYIWFKNCFGKSSKYKTLCICSQMDGKTLIQDDNDEKMDNDQLNEALNEFKQLSDVTYTTDVNEIKYFLSHNNDNSHLFIFSTYQSSKLLKGYNFNIGIYDEAHKTTGASFGKTLKDDFTKINKRIFLTATPKYRKQKNNSENDLSQVIAMNNPKLYGKPAYEYTFTNAINNGHILDYQLILCYHYDNNLGEYNYLDLLQKKYIIPNEKELIIDDPNMLLSAFMLARVIKNNVNNDNDKISKILTYHNKVKHANKFKELLEFILKKYCKINDKICKVWVMSGRMKMTQRKELFHEFENECDVGIICSSRVLNEGINLPFVDTVMFVQPRRSTIDIIQCIGRGLRLYKNMTKCNILLPIYYDELAKSNTFQCILQILIAIKEHDKSLIMYQRSKKIKMMNFNFNGHNDDTFDEKEDEDVDMNDEMINDKLFEELCTKMLQSSFLRWEYKKQLLFEYSNINRRCCGQNTEYKNQNIGSWLADRKKKIKSSKDKIYIELSHNKYVKANLDQFLLDKKTGKRFPFEEGKKLLFEYCNEFKECPKDKKTTYKNKGIGQWFSGQKGKIKSKNDDKYKALSQNEYVKNELNKNLERKNKKNSKPELSNDEYKALLFKYCNENNKYPTYREKYGKQQTAIGQWLARQVKKIESKNDTLYIELSVNKYCKQKLDECLSKRGKDNFEVKMKLLFEYCNKHKKTPTKKIEIIGKWFTNQKVYITSNQDDKYKKLSVNKYVKQSLDKCLEHRKKNKNKPTFTMEQSKALLFEWCNKENKCPSRTINYKGKNIGGWLGDRKKSITSTDDKWYKILSENKCVKQSLDICVANKNKKEKKRKKYDEYEQDVLSQTKQPKSKRQKTS
eukprot:49092_1